VRDEAQSDGRAELLRRTRKLVVKIGSSILADGRGIDRAHLERLVEQIAALHARGVAVTVVTSGAIAAGRASLGGDAPRTIPERQAAAAVGQILLMAEYQRAFAARGIVVAQLLLDAADLANRRRYLNAAHAVASLHARGVLPIVNENDTVAVDELKFGDNDNLSALVASLVGADLLLILSDVDGLYSANPRTDSTAELIPLVAKVEAAILERASTPGSELGTGGMRSKLLAARKAASAGIATVIANGRRPEVLRDALDPTVEIGTLVLPLAGRLARRKHWIAFSVKPSGSVQCDAGAVAAVKSRGRSLLPSGILAVSGRFAAGDCVRLLGPDGQEFARGLCTYGATEVARILGKRSDEVERILGYRMGDAVVHRNDLVITAGGEPPPARRGASPSR
jgi:glutamate 5-kinase